MTFEKKPLFSCASAARISLKIRVGSLADGLLKETERNQEHRTIERQKAEVNKVTTEQIPI